MVDTINTRLIVAVDFKPQAAVDIHESLRELKRVIDFASSILGTNVTLKLNVSIHLCGYGLITELKAMGFKVMVDLKLSEIPETMERYAIHLAPFEPDILTVMCQVGRYGMKVVRQHLPRTEIIGVTVLTSIDEQECGALYGRRVPTMVERFANRAYAAGLDGCVAAPSEIGIVKKGRREILTVICPGIRPRWSAVEGDDQDPARVRTPARALQLGADYIVIGRPIIQAADPYRAGMRTLEEMTNAI